MSTAIQYEGLREIAQALREVDKETLAELTRDLGDVGHVVEHEAVDLFDAIDARSAAGFDTRVRINTSSMALVSVGQSLRKTTGRRPDYGTLQVEDALLPARDRKIGEAVHILEDGAMKLLRRHGIT